ncbi:MAG TPA: sortase [Thermomicrobiaceae bacterium]|nr:sortase [Thermomicrobiaceae bacterium]
MSHDLPRRADRRGRERRAGTLGNLLIVLGIALLGSALSLTTTSVGGVSLVRAASDATAPPLISALPASLTATPFPPPEATPAGTPVLAASIATPSATPVTVTPAAAPSAATSVTVSTPAPPVAHAPATRIQIPAVGIDTQVVNVGFDVVTIQGQQLIQWRVADYAAGHNSLSANPGEGGNVVISGHDDWRGEVFRNLDLAKVGDQVILTTADRQVRYAVTEIVYRKVVGVSLSDQLATGTYLAPMPEERVTLVTCWPYGVDDHRLIVIAKPVKP